MIQFRILTLFISLSIAISACNNRVPDAPSNETVSVTGETEGAPAGCSANDVAQRLKDLFDSISRGDPAVVNEFFGQTDGSRFQWYSMTEVNGDGDVVKHHFVAYQLDEVNSYFQERYQQHEQLQLQSIQFNGWNGAIGTIEFGPVAFTREADDLGANHSRFSGTGKGTYFCDQRAFIVLSLVTQTP